MSRKSIRKALIRYIGTKEVERVGVAHEGVLFDLAREKAKQSALEGNGPTLTSKEIMQGLSVDEKVELLTRIFANKFEEGDYETLSRFVNKTQEKRGGIRIPLLSGSGVMVSTAIAFELLFPAAAPLVGAVVGVVGLATSAAVAYGTMKVLPFLTGTAGFEESLEKMMLKMEADAIKNIKLEEERANNLERKEAARKKELITEAHQVVGIKIGSTDKSYGNVR